MLSTYTANEVMPDCGDYTLACWRGGWIVYKGDERRWPVAAGFATSAQAEDWIDHARAGDALHTN